MNVDSTMSHVHVVLCAHETNGVDFKSFWWVSNHIVVIVLIFDYHFPCNVRELHIWACTLYHWLLWWSIIWSFVWWILHVYKQNELKAWHTCKYDQNKWEIIKLFHLNLLKGGLYTQGMDVTMVLLPRQVQPCPCSLGLC